MLLNPKPIGAFVEYTLKPLIDDSIELLEYMEKQGIPAKDLAKISLLIFVYERTLSLIQAVIVTSIISYTILCILRSHPTLL